MSTSKESSFLSALSADEVNELRNDIIRKVMRRGRAGALDLANEIRIPKPEPRLINVDELISLLEGLVKEGVLRVAQNTDKTRELPPLYELAI